ncbi:GntR family transcriptional regulator [Cryobacterium arcticum]|uniref:GntR family transcriptional regulator n=1 Tax=Cryobacterium arcticum TaxID=670052 RepID=A0A1B1BLQ8_9MICO|nr:GntR family transcriptional regulator [Cryobacterium arcticum]ANP73597.1 GntR family transcriptional regulator [Cryobacterium arcticum]
MMMTANGASSQTVQLYDRLRAAILSLQLAPGERLTERGLEASFDASRTPVRAALGRLDAEGLVQRDGRGWIVSPIDLAEIGALAELREAVEAAAVRLAVVRASDDDIAVLAAVLDAARPARAVRADVADAPTSGDDDAEEGVRAGGDFHVELSRLSGNPVMVDAVRNAMTRLARTRWLEVRTPAAREQAWREHRAVLDALEARDADAAAGLLTDHIRGTNDRLLAALAADTRRLRGHGLAIVADAPVGAVH